MNTTLKVTLAVVAVVAVAVGLGAGFAFAQGVTPWGGYGMMENQEGMTLAPARSAGVSGLMSQNGTPVPGDSFMNGQGGLSAMGGMMSSMNGVDMNAMHQWMSADGAQSMHTLVFEGLAKALNLTPAELKTQLASGKTLTQIADAQGVSQDELTAALETLMKAGLDKAVADGVFTRAQADQMLNQMSGRYQWMLTQMGSSLGFGNGHCHENAGQPNNS